MFFIGVDNRGAIPVLDISLIVNNEMTLSELSYW
jgi:hypothetical protein